MILFPPAKINLGLNVLGKRPDGYHEIDTCMYPIQWTDVLELIPQDTFDFVQTGLIVDGPMEDNLCVKAFRQMQAHFNVPNVYMHLQKNIPMGAGLGGGSSDAAYVLKGINELFDLGVGNEKLMELAAELGSDCPFFIEAKPQLGQGRGELLREVDVNLKGYFIKVIHPGIHVGTKEAYQGVRFPEDQVSLSSLLRQPISSWRHTLQNSFEATVMPKHKGIEDLKLQMYSEGAVFAAMSGSGSSVFGIYENRPIVSNSASAWIGELE